MIEVIVDAFLQAAPVLSAGITVAVVAFMRGNVLSRLNPAAIPVLLPAASGIMSSLGAAVGFPIDPISLTQGDVDAWQGAVNGILNGMVAVGAHQALRQTKKLKEEGVAQ
jgi:hypothetical protein